MLFLDNFTQAQKYFRQASPPCLHHLFPIIVIFGLRNFCFVKKLCHAFVKPFLVEVNTIAFYNLPSGKVERVWQDQVCPPVYVFFSKLYTWIWWMGGSCTPVVSPFHHFASQGSLTKLCTPAFWFRVRSRKCSCQINRLLVTDSLSLTKVINPGPFTMGREHFPLPARPLLQGRISQEAS